MSNTKASSLIRYVTPAAVAAAFEKARAGSTRPVGILRGVNAVNSLINESRGEAGYVMKAGNELVFMESISLLSGNTEDWLPVYLNPILVENDSHAALIREANDLDSILVMLGLNPDDYRTEGGSVMLEKIRGALGLAPGPVYP